MSTPISTRRDGGFFRFLRFRPRVACVAAVFLFLSCVAKFHQPDYGFTSLISIGDILNDSKVRALREIPHYVYDGSAGYDGSYYVQLALYPALDNPELTKAIDNLPYRAKRILLCWVAWLLGLGQSAWVVQAFALLNVGCWLALAWVLFRWFPPDGWENFFRWAVVLFSHGLCMSVRHSLVDGPSLLLVALAMRWLEDGRRVAGGATLALAGLGKETSLLACAGLDLGGPDGWRSPRVWARAAFSAGLIALPLFAWMAYVRFRFGPAEDPGLGNFTLPFFGFAEKLAAAWHDVTGPDATPLAWATLATVLALAVQGGFFAWHRRPAERWWRIGAAFAFMMIFLSTPVWEGFPGASTRVLLPMTLAFNVLVPRGRRWLPLLLAGNLTVAATVFEYSPPHEFYTVRGAESVRAAVRVVPAKGWHGPEQHAKNQWRWTSGTAELRLQNNTGGPVQAAVSAQAMSVEGTRALRVLLGERLLWGATITTRTPAEIRFGLVLPPGETVLTFSSDRPAQKIGTDPRLLAYQIANLEIVVRPAPATR
jgi:hypothetical protein